MGTFTFKCSKFKGVYLVIGCFDIICSSALAIVQNYGKYAYLYWGKESNYKVTNISMLDVYINLIDFRTLVLAIANANVDVANR